MMDLNANATDGILAKLLYLAVTLVVTAIAARIVGRVSEKALDKARIPSASLFVNVARALVWLAGVLLVVKPVFDIEPTSFVTAVGIVSVALSLGLQDTISNLIGGVSLLMSHMVVPGDKVTIDGITGTVIDVNWRAITVEDLIGNIQVIPNSVLNSSSVFKIKPTNFQTVSVQLLIRSDADLAAVEADILTRGAEALGDRLGDACQPVVRYKGMNAGGIAAGVSFPVKEGVNTLTGSDDVMRSFSQRPWLAGIGTCTDA